MKDFVVILASPTSTSTSITNPHQHHYHCHQHRHRRRYVADSSLNHSSGSSLAKSAPTSQSVTLISPSRSSHISSTVRSDSNTYLLAGDGGVGELNVEVVARGILQDVERGNVESVIEVLRRINELGISPASLLDEALLKSLRKQFRRMVDSGELEEIVCLVEILAGFEVKIKELVDPFDVIKSCIDNCNSDLAIRYACLLPHAQLLFCKIIQEIGKKGDMVSVMSAYKAIKVNMDAPNMYLYRTIIDVCGLCGDYMKSRYIYEDILSQNTTPNIYVLNSLMNVNSHDLGYTLDVYKNMQKLGISADMASYNILLKACCLAGRVDLAQDIYNEAKRLECAGGLRLDAFTYCTIIKVFADAKLWKMALKVKEDMLTAGVTPNTFTWSSLISACANAGLVEQAMLLFEEMLQAGCEPNSQCFNVVLHACVEAYQYDRAFRLFQSWKRISDQASGDQSRNQRFSSSGQMTKHGEISKLNSGSSSHSMQFSKRFFFAPTTATYNILLRACGTDYYRAKALMDEMKTLGLSPNHISWSTLMNVCGSSGDVQGAIKILRAMHTAGIKPDVVAYTTAIKVCVEGKRLKLAFSLFEEMRRYQIKPNLVTYNTLLRARSRYGSLFEVRQCLTIYQDMRRAGYKPNDYYLKQLIEEWCEGVILEDGQDRDEILFQKGADTGRPLSLLIEKVAQHLQENAAESFAIDVQGLTKVEARIVVLAVLRMIKESYIQGDAVKDDVWIIVGTGGVGIDSAKHEIAVKNALVKLMRDELGLEVLAAVPNNLDEDLKENLTTMPPPSSSSSSTRRPAFLQRLKVTKKSLRKWLQQRLAASRSY